MTRQIKKGSANVSVELYIIDSTDGTPETGVVFDTSGIDLNYRRDGAAVVSITEIDLTTSTLTDAHEDGGFLHVANGRYRFDIPDAAFATGVSQVTVGGTVTGMVVLPLTIQLVDFDPDDATRMGLTALPNAAADAAGGLPISDAGGLDIDAKLANTNEITVARMGALTDWIDAGRLDTLLDAIPTTAAPSNFSALVITASGIVDANLEQIQGGATGAVTNFKDEYDGTASFSGNYARHQTATAGAANSITLDVGAPSTVDIFKDCPIAITGGTGAGQQNWISAYSAGRVATVVKTWDTNPDATSVFSIGRYIGGSLFNVEIDTGTTLENHLTDIKGTGFVKDTDSLPQCLTATGFSTHDAAAVWTSGTRTLTAATNITSDGNVITMSSSGVIGTVNLVNTLTTYTGNTLQTGDSFARMGAGGVSLNDLGGMSATMKAQVNTEVDTAFTTQMADSVPADGTISTREQALYALLQILTDFSISGTTMTVKKVDGTTTLMTFTLDDGTSPTSLTRAT